MTYLNMKDLEFNNKRVLIREDFNVPIHDGQITDTTRIDCAIPTIQAALKQGAAVILVSHLGRPTEGVFDEKFSLAPVAKELHKQLNHPVRFEKTWIDGVSIQPGEIVLCENVRFLKGENANDESLSQKMAALCDIFVMDAFATAHRAQASTVGVARFAKIACAGPLLDAELQALSQALTHPKKPVVAIVGGSKVSTKIDVLKNLLDKVDVLVVGGGIANTCLKAAGYDVGASLCESDYLQTAKELMTAAKAQHVQMPLPVDVAVAKSFSKDEKAIIKSIDAIAADDMILDIGPKTIELYQQFIAKAHTIVWNGPVGVFEFANFSNGTQALANAIAQSDAYSIAGGGDTVSAITQFGVENQISYISTGGGAFLEWMEGKSLPGVEILQKRNSVCQ